MNSNDSLEIVVDENLTTGFQWIVYMKSVDTNMNGWELPRDLLKLTYDSHNDEFEVEEEESDEV